MICKLHRFSYSITSVVAFFCIIIHHVHGHGDGSGGGGNLVSSTTNTTTTTNSLPETGGEQWTYLYNANTTVTSNLSSDAASQWSLSAKLIIQSFKSYKIMKLDDIRTTIFNGPTNTNNINIEETNLPLSTSSILTEPFVVYYNKKYDKLLSISFTPDDQEWSKNIKKAIGSAYQLDLSNVYSLTKEESNIHGKCKVIYENLSSNDEIKIAKEINSRDCVIENSLKHYWDDIPLGHFTGKTIRYYNFEKNQLKLNNTPFKNIESNSTFLYSMLKSDRTILEIKQSQHFTLTDTKILDNAIDLTKYSINTTPIYEFSNNTRTEPKESHQSILLKWMDHFHIIKNQINKNSSTIIDEYKFNIIDKLRNYLTEMDATLLEHFKTNNFVGDSQMMNIFSSMLPYIGTEASVDFIRTKIQEEVFTLAHVRLLALFPLYVENTNEVLLTQMEQLLSLKNVTNPTIKQNFILSFSNLVYQTFYSKLSSSNNYTETEALYRTISKKYVQDYYNFFLDAQEYGIRMKYLLGMMNMGEEALPYLYKIVRNSTESRHIRSLAIYCIKPNLSDKSHKNHEVYQFFWPIVKNASEPFEIRAAALSLLLGTNINSSELYSILSYMNQTSFDPAKQHLHNYFYTAAISGNTDCNCTMKNLAKAMLSNLNPPETNQGLLTSYHQVSYTDDEKNFHTSLNLHVVANPITNFANVFKLTLNHFTGGDKTGEFSIYVKAEGISSKLYKEEYERHYAIKELYKILQEMKLVFNSDFSENLHIEVILFYQKNAMFSLFINIDNVDEMSDFIDELIVYLGNNDIVTIRDVRKMHFTSDLGTPLFVTLNYEHILGTEFGNYDKIFQNFNSQDDDDENYVLTRIRSMWSSKLNFISHNPLTNTNHGVSKIYSLQNFVKFKIDYNVYDLSIKWNDNTSYLDTLIDYKYAIFIDHDYLKNVCLNCQPVVFISEKRTAEKNLTLWLWAKNILIKEINCTNPRFPSNPLHSIIKKSRVSYTGLPFMQPFVLIAYIADYFYYIPQHETCTLSINTERIVKEPNLSTLKITFINDALDENYKLNLNFNITLALTQCEMPSRKKLHQWNLNLQRQELLTGVSYELHYDDNGRSVKFDVKSDLDYLPTSPNADMFSLKPAEPIVSRTLFHLKEINAEPTVVQIKSIFSISDDQIELVNASKSFELCQKDHESEIFNEVLVRHTPPTISCHNASIGLSTYDNYEINIQFKNVSSKMREYLRDEILKPIKDKEFEGQDIINDKSFNVSIIYSALYSSLNMEVGQTHVVSNYTVPELVRPWVLLKPTSRLIDELRYNMFGLDNVCIIIPRYVISFTGKIIEHDTDTTIIPLIECTNTTQLGLTTNRFTYKLWSDENTFQLGKKEGGYYVMRNKKFLRHNTRADDYSIEFVNDHTFRITTSRIDLYYNGEYLTVKIKSAFINRMCGMCTTNEYVAPNTVNKYFN